MRGEVAPKCAADYEYFEMEYGYEATDLDGTVPDDLWLGDNARNGPSAGAIIF